jgi:class 3 adenylate cyclase
VKSSNLAIVFVDIAGFTERTASQSRAESEAWLRQFEQMIMPLLRAFGGRRIKTIGDAYLCTFASPTNALLFGMASQDRLFSYNREVDEASGFQIRVAVNAGEVRLQRRDVFGEPVNIAARVEGLAPAGAIWFTEAVYLAMTKSEVPAEEVGLKKLKGIAEDIKIYRVPLDHGYRLAPDEPPSAQETSRPDETSGPAVDRFPYGGIGLRRAEERGWAMALGAVPERLVQAGQSLASGLWDKLRSICLPGLSWKIWAGIAGIALLVVVISIAVSMRPFAKCLSAIDDAQYTQAQLLLDAHPDRKTPPGRSLQARIWLRKAKPNVQRAAKVLQVALEGDVGLLADGEYINDLVLCLNRRHAGKAIDFLVDKAGERALGPLVQASADKRYWLRWNAVKALKKLGRADEVDLVGLYLQDLEHAGRCSVRKQAAQKLAEFKDSRALKPLRRAKQRNFLDNICMGGTLDWAIKTIEDD